MGWCGILDQVGDQLQHILVIPHIPKGVIAERCIRVKQIEHPDFIPDLLKEATSFTQNFLR